MAGLSTTIGGLLALITGKPGRAFTTLSLGFSAGVMVMVSFVELLASGIEVLGFPLAQLAFFVGMGIMFLIDAAIPHDYIAEHGQCRTRPGRRRRKGRGAVSERSRLLRVGLCTAIGVTIHNFPEGMASFAGGLHDVAVGTAIGAAIALHNIPEGLAIASPVYAATGSRLKAFSWAFLSGVAEPIGALLAALALAPFLSEVVLGYVLSAVAGIMVFVALDELLPVAQSYEGEHRSIVGVMAGMAVMALSLWLLA
jgi:ZIP family zinc transporter